MIPPETPAQEPPSPATGSPESVWRAAEAAVAAGDAAALGRLLAEHGPFLRRRLRHSAWCGGQAPDFSATDAGAIVARGHHFRCFEELERHRVEVGQGGSPAAAFEAAVDAVVAGDLAALEDSLRRSPALVDARSSRTHRATLLHYIGANGVESWRQRTAANAVAIAGALLRAGAEVDALADLYGGATTLGLVATSLHPVRIGVQDDLLNLLLGHGAAVEPPRAAGGGRSIVNDCLATGRPGAAELLAARGARLDLEGAAGVGRLEAVRGFFAADSGLQGGATPDQMKSGFQWACQYGRTEVVGFLLGRGARADEMHRGQTGLHWAAYGGHAEIVRRLLAAGPAVDLPDERFGNTPLGWALYGRASPPLEVGGGRPLEVVALLVGAGAAVAGERVPAELLAADPRLAAALHGGLPEGSAHPSVRWTPAADV
ncbi:MAG: ankyrin repeat domain-containing protein [Limisphaerales bacterium]